MTRPFLASKHLGINAPAVFSVLNGRITQIGPAFSVVETWIAGQSSSEAQPRNRVIEFEGQLYCQHNGAVWQYDGSVWNSAVTWSSPGDDAMQAGLYSVSVSGTSFLYSIWNNNAVFGRIKKEGGILGNGTNWSSTKTQTLTGFTTNSEKGIDDVLLVHNRLYMQTQKAAAALQPLAIFDMERDSWFPIDHATNYPHNDVSLVVPVGDTSFCAYNGTLYQLLRAELPGSIRRWSSSYYIENITGGGFIPSIDLVLATGLVSNGLSNNGWSGMNNEMFVDRSEGNMYAFTHIRGTGNPPAADDNLDGWAIWEITDSGGSLECLREVSTNVLPESLRYNNSSLTAPANTARFFSHNLVDASGNESIVIEYTPDGDDDTLVNFYLWNGPDLELTLLDFGSFSRMSRPKMKQGGGHRLFSDTQPYDIAFSIDDTSVQTPGTVGLNAMVLGSGEDISLRFFFNTKGETPDALCTISNATSGVIVGNVLTGITATSGVIYQVDWDGQGDGVNFGQSFAVLPTAVTE